MAPARGEDGYPICGEAAAKGDNEMQVVNPRLPLLAVR